MVRLSFYNEGLFLSHSIPDVVVYTDSDWVDFVLKCEGATLFAGRYYAYEGRVDVTDIAALVEGAMLGLTNLAQVEIEASDPETRVGAKFAVLFCDRLLDVADPLAWLGENFLTLAPTRRLAPDGVATLQWYAQKGETVEYRLAAMFSDLTGTIHTAEWPVYIGDAPLTAPLLEARLVDLAVIAAYVEREFAIASPTLLSVTARAGERSATFYVDPSLRDVVPFHYLNCFGVPEQLPLPRTTTAKTKTDHSLARLGGRVQFYDTSYSQEYEVQSGALTAAECGQVAQLLTSADVRIAHGENCSPWDSDFEALIPVLITDYTCELADNAAEPNAVKFTWRFATEGLSATAPKSQGIFQRTFKLPYS